MTAVFIHESVMLEEILDVFAGVEEGTFLDATLGGAGHAAEILVRHPHLRLLGIDQDPHALDAARSHLDARGVSERATLRRGRFDLLARIVAEEGVGSLAGALFDLGVSSPQFDIAERGFSYRHEGPLDMRMDPEAKITAHDIVNTWPMEHLARMLKENADERWATRIARAVVAARPVHTTRELADIIVAAIPAPARRRGGHPAKRSFQAIRIEVNAELSILAGALRAAIDLLSPGARLAVLSYHSGEDRIVKSVMRTAESGGCACPAGLPCVCGASRAVRRVRVSETASESELQRNPRSSSARLRVVERLDAGDR